MAIDMSKPAPKYWLCGSPVLTSFAYAMSAIFPVGERFFVNAVRAALPQLDSTALQATARAFMGQESHHAHLHVQYNARAQAEGFQVHALTARLEPVSRWVQRATSVATQLAITAAFEHFTAMLSTQVLAEDDFLGDAPEPHRTLWRWHAAEEAEHKAVAFDVFQAVDGRYVRRVVWYLLISLSFTLATSQRVLYLMWHDGTLLQRGNLIALMAWLFGPSGMMTRVMPRWFAYLRPSFHPDDHDDSELIAEWENEVLAHTSTVGKAS